MPISAAYCPFPLAACAELLCTDRPLIERAQRWHDAGYAAELWILTHPNLVGLRKPGATLTSMTGYIDVNLTDPPEIQRFLDSAARSLDAAETHDCWHLTVHGTGLGESGIPSDSVAVTTPCMWLAARETLACLADMGRGVGRIFILENLNLAVDYPGMPFNRAADTKTLVESIDSPYLRMNLDLYYAQIDEGHLIDLVRAATRSVKSRSPTCRAE